MRIEDLILGNVDDHIIEPPDMYDRHVPAQPPRVRPARRRRR